MLGKIDLHVPQLEETYILRNILFNLGLLKKPPSLCSPCTAQLLQLVPQEIETLTQRNEQEVWSAEKSKGSRVTKCPWICARCDFFITIICLSNCPTIPISMFKILVEFSTVDKPETHRISPNCMFGIMFLLGMIEFLILGILG